MSEYHNVEMWIGGKFVEGANLKLKYEGGHKHKFVNVDLDRFNLDDISEMYGKCGGKKPIVNFYFKRPGVSLEMGLRTINKLIPDLSIQDLINCYEGLEDPVVLYAEEIDDAIESILTNEDNAPDETEMRLLMSGIDFNDEYEQAATQQFMETETCVDRVQNEGVGTENDVQAKGDFGENQNNEG
ncbi:hypothetical protein BUALT_Bualt12G0101600 [Buddleja alternifolia]|uniref:PB1-like domain-containing protein n=1 Tax=Buddleja alternifolia TaxID=168488 RepID=A0AAV6WWU5_9LAMI|nr:hypothetical protein BUALT_Bualt12G0101600 [Buddleja alternifolia]